ncbi:hypothetical protein BH09SUM1_BH09SUM1_05280 [soil metagenome]
MTARHSLSIVWVAFAFLLATCIASAQMEPREWEYPAFVSAASETTPTLAASTTPTTGTLDIADAQTSAGIAMEDATSLVADLQSTETWTQTRERIPPAIEELRLLFLSRAAAKEIDAQEEKLASDIDLIVRMAEFQAPNEERGLDSLSKRMEKQISLVISDYNAGEFVRMGITDDLLRKSLRDWNELLVRSDIERGSQRFESQPAGWNVERFADPDFTETARAMDARELLTEYRQRQIDLTNDFRDDRWKSQERSLREMGELARQLADRSYEVPLTSRVTYRNAALRLDVMAENSWDYVRKGNRPYARRQIRAMGKAIDEVDEFLKLKSRGL